MRHREGLALTRGEFASSSLRRGSSLTAFAGAGQCWLCFPCEHAQSDPALLEGTCRLVWRAPAPLCASGWDRGWLLAPGCVP